MDLSKVVWIPIDGLPTIPVYVVCPRTPWGKEKIVQIDRIIAELAKTTAYRDLLRPWSSARTWKRIAAEQKAFYDKREQPLSASYWQ